MLTLQVQGPQFENRRASEKTTILEQEDFSLRNPSGFF